MRGQSAAAAIAAATLALGALGAANPAAAAPAADQQVSVPVSNADLLSPSGYVDLKSRIAATAQAYCRAHPIGPTVASCARDIAEALRVQAEGRRQAMTSAPNTYAQARR